MHNIKPEPECDEFHTTHLCHKCGGTGFYCEGYLNGRPYSHTGFDCFGCGGTGWKVVWKRGGKKAFWANVKPMIVLYNEDGSVREYINPNGELGQKRLAEIAAEEQRREDDAGYFAEISTGLHR